MKRGRIVGLFLVGILFFLGFFFVFWKVVKADWANHLVISEVQISENEFVELYNPTNTAIDLYRNGDPFYFSYFSKDRDWNNPYRNKPFPEGSTIPAYGFYLIGLKGYTTSTADWVVYTSAQLSDTSGGVAIFPWDPTKKSPEEAKNGRIDALGWGDVTYVKEESAVSTPSRNNSLERKPANNYGNGEETDNNLQDFILQTSPNPQNSQSQIEPPQSQGPVCGNNIKESGEDCDGTDLDQKTCLLLGWVGGSLSCHSNCTFNTSNCNSGGEGGGSSTRSTTYRSSDIVINEFVSDPIDGEEEWVELYNNTDKEIDLTDWKIEEGGGALTNLSGTIKPKDFFVVEKIKGYLNNSGDIIILRDSNNQIIDQVVYDNWDDGDKSDNASVTKDPNSVARIVDGYDTDQDNLDFKISTLPTKGEPNKFSSEKEYPFGVILNELLPNPKGDDSENEFIELKNLSDQEVDLDGWKLEDAAGTRFVISSSHLDGLLPKIPAKGFIVIWRKHSKIALNNSGTEILKLYQPNDNLVDTASYSGGVADDVAYAKDEKNNWFWTTKPTPSEENIIKKINQKPKAVISGPNKALAGEEIIFDASDSYDPDGDVLTYSWDFGDGTKSQEILVKHIYKRAGKYNIKLEVRDSAGASETAKLTVEILAGEEKLSYSPLEAEILITEFLPNPKGKDDQEWIEIYNAGDKEVDLAGWFLDDIDGGSKPYQIKEGTKILPGEYLVFERKETKIALNNNFDSVRILDPERNLFFEVSHEKAKEGLSYALDENNEWHWTSVLTPGEKNIFSGENGETKSKIKTSAEKEKILEIPLSEIRNQDIGDLLKVEGVVSVEPGILGSQIFYLSGSGVQVYSYKKNFPDLKVGDRVEVIGELSEYRGETRIKISLKDDIKILKSEISPQPEEVKTGEIDENLEGSLVSIQGELIESRFSYFYLDDGSGEIKVYLKNTANIKKPKIKEGEWLKVIGIVSQYGEEYRLLPRYQTDIEIIKKPAGTDKLRVAGALSGTKTPFIEKINPFSRTNRSAKVKYLSLSALTLFIILLGLIIKKKRQKL